MLKSEIQRRLKLLSTIAIILLILIYVGLISQANNMPTQNPNSHKNEPVISMGRTSSTQSDTWMLNSTRVSAFAAIAMAIIGGFQLYAFIQSEKGRSESDLRLRNHESHIRETSIRQVRAYVSVHVDNDEPVILDFGPGFCRFSCGINIVNNGNTPAKSVRLSMDTKIMKPGEAITDAFVKEYCGAFNAPDITMKGGIRKPWDQPMVDEDGKLDKFSKTPIAMMGKMEIRLFGLIEYMDVFDVERKTQFSFYVQYQGKDSYRLQATQDYNKAT